MAVIKNVELFWVKIDPERPQHYQNKKENPGQWNLQIRTRDKKVSKDWKDKYGLAVTMDEDDKGNFYRASLSTYAYAPNGDLNRPVQCVSITGMEVDPKIVGNGSMGNVSFTVDEKKEKRRLRAVQLTKLVKFEQKTALDEFEFDEDGEFEVVEAEDKPADKKDEELF